jgi:HSP20 family protein
MRIIRYNYPRNAVRLPDYVNPWAGLESQIDRMLGGAFGSFLAENEVEATTGQPRIDLYQDKENFHFRGELPGVKKDDIQVEAGDGVLTLSGTRKSYGSDGETKETTKFSRSLSVPAPVQDDKIAARYEDGVLTITLPKAEEVKPKKIAVQVK